MDEQAKAQIADYEQRFGAAKLRANEERVKVRTEAALREREITEAARREADGAVETSRARLAEDAAKARAELAPRAQEVSRAIVKKILGREVA
jgi:F0F1-type ATP synthase membrane subunit b/b'